MYAQNSKLNEYTIFDAPQIEMSNIHKNCGLKVFRPESKTDFGNLRPKEQKLRCFKFYCIAHMYSGRGFYIDEHRTKTIIKAGDCIFVSPNKIHLYGAEFKKKFSEDTINFCGPLANMLYQNGLFFDGIIPLGLTRQLLPIIKLAQDPSEKAQLNLTLEIQKFLYNIYNRKFSTNTTDMENRIDKLLLMLKENPERWWSLDELASFCNLSEPQFRKQFVKRVGLLPKLYIDKLKMNFAANLIYEEKLPMLEIAKRIGYSDPFHFSRRFKAIIGMSPQSYRLKEDKQG